MLSVDYGVGYDLEPVIQGAAYRISRKFPGTVELDDLRQEIRVWVLAHIGKIARLVEEKLEDDPKSVDQKLTLWFCGVAEKYARRQRAQALGFDPSDEYFYDLAMLERLLPYALADDLPDGLERQVQEGPRGLSDPAEAGNLMALILDVRRALGILSGGQRRVLEAMFLDGSTEQLVGDEWRTSRSSVHKIKRRALRRLRLELGGRRPWSQRKAAA